MWKILQNRDIYILHLCKCMCLSMHFASCKARCHWTPSQVQRSTNLWMKHLPFMVLALSRQEELTVIWLQFPPITFKCYVWLSMNFKNHSSTYCYIIICEKAKQHFNKCEYLIAVQLSWCLPLFNILITSQRWIQTPFTFKNACLRWIITLFVSQLEVSRNFSVNKLTFTFWFQFQYSSVVCVTKWLIYLLLLECPLPCVVWVSILFHDFDLKQLWFHNAC